MNRRAEEPGVAGFWRHNLKSRKSPRLAGCGAVETNPSLIPLNREGISQEPGRGPSNYGSATLFCELQFRTPAREPRRSRELLPHYQGLGKSTSPSKRHSKDRVAGCFTELDCRSRGFAFRRGIQSTDAGHQAKRPSCKSPIAISAARGPKPAFDVLALRRHGG